MNCVLLFRQSLDGYDLKRVWLARNTNKIEVYPKMCGKDPIITIKT